MTTSPAARGSHGVYELHCQPRTAGQELAMGRLNATQTSERADDRNGGGASRQIRFTANRVQLELKLSCIFDGTNVA